MKTEVGICNLALSWLGAELITSLTDETTEGQLCDQLYAPTRDVVLEATDWTFAMQRDTLSPEVATPEFGWAYQFTIPTTFLRVITVSDDINRASENTVEWVVEGNKILCDSAVIYVRYLVQVTDTTRFSYTFCHALAARLAADMAIPLVESKTLQAQMYKLYEAKLKEATGSDGRQGRSQKIYNRDLLNVR